LEDITTCIYSFADVEGKIVSALPPEDFMRYRDQHTHKILSLRFYDGETVFVEFVDFFTQSPNSRVARSAAVRGSLNFLQLQDSDDTWSVWSFHGMSPLPCQDSVKS
jgi:hypothetical protein